MFDAARVNTALYQRLGWRQPTKTGLPTLDADNKVTNSGRYFQDFHSLVTVENIWDCQLDSEISDSEFNTLLDSFQKAAIQKVIANVFQQDDVIENHVLFPYENVWTNTLTNEGDFVGYEFQVAKDKDISVVINSLIAEFDAEEAIIFYLFHSSQQTAIDSQEITTTTNSSKETNVTWNLEASKYQGGTYYIGYLTTGLTAQAVNREYDLANVQSGYKCVGIQPIKVSGWTSASLFDIEDIEYEGDTYGLNFDISSLRNFTNIIEQNKQIFDEAIGWQMAVDVLELIASSVRENRVERITKSFAFDELNRVPNAENNYSYSIKKRLEKELDKVKHTLFGKAKIKTFTIT